jgi:hypothetical protein
MQSIALNLDLRFLFQETMSEEKVKKRQMLDFLSINQNNLSYGTIQILMFPPYVTILC